MQSVDPGILSKSVCFSFTPSQRAKDLLFYPTWCGHYFCTDNYYMKRDSYPPLLIVYIRRGRFRVEYRGEFRVAEAGDVLLIDCVEPHYYHAEDGLEFVYMHFDGSNSHELCRSITDQQDWLIRCENNTLIGNLLYDMVQFYNSNSVETDMQSSARIYRIFDLLLAPSAQEMSADDPIEQAIQYIRTNIGKAISVEDLASSVCLSTSYFAHMFKRRTGFSPADYVINSRIERAKVLLVRTQKPIGEIAEEVGYATSGSLINLFVKKVGSSPKQYRSEHLSGALRRRRSTVAYRRQIGKLGSAHAQQRLTLPGFHRERNLMKQPIFTPGKGITSIF